MRTLLFWAIIISVGISQPAHGQLLKKLQKRAQDAVERTILRKTDEVVTKTTENTIDGAISGVSNSGNSNNQTSSNQNEQSNSALTINTEAKRQFYKEDVIINLKENGKENQTQYFDADQIAVRTEQSNMPKPNFIDSEGFVYTYKDGEYTKSSLVALQSQGMMIPTMMMEIYKLPPEPAMANLQKQTDMGLTANPFNGFVEFSFVYKPEQFRYEDFNEVNLTENGKNYTKFEYLNEPGYEGSYVLFDNQDRLVKVYSNKTDTGETEESFEFGSMPTPPGERIITYNYSPVTVNLPPAREVRMQGQGLMEMVMGGAVKGGNIPKANIDDSDYDTSDSKGQVKAVKKSINSHKVTADMLPESYAFNYKYNTILSLASQKNEDIEMNFLFNTQNPNYQGLEFMGEKTKKHGKMMMITDKKLNSMAMFIQGKNNQNIVQLFPLPETTNTNTKIDMDIKEVPNKTIIGYDCKGLQMDNDAYTLTIYHANNAPITLSNFFSFSGNQKIDLPNINPKLVEQFSNGLITEMQYIDKTKSKNNFTLTAQSLEKVDTVINKKSYQSMDMFSLANRMKN